MGRSAHSDLTGDVPLAPSAIPQSGLIEVADYKKKPAEMPKPMDENDIKTTLNDFKLGAQRALGKKNHHTTQEMVTHGYYTQCD